MMYFQSPEAITGIPGITLPNDLFIMPALMA